MQFRGQELRTVNLDSPESQDFLEELRCELLEFLALFLKHFLRRHSIVMSLLGSILDDLSLDYPGLRIIGVLLLTEFFIH